MPEPTIEFIARGVLVVADHLLVCRNAKHGHRFLPGGHVDFNEPARDALLREMREEAGGTFQAGRFLGALEAAFNQRSRRHHEVNLLFELHLPTAGPSPATRTTTPPFINSLEPHIVFEWIPLHDLIGDPPRVALLPDGLEPFLTPPQQPQWASQWS